MKNKPIIIKDLQTFKQYRNKWKRLVSKSGCKSYFQSYHWLTNWWAIFGQNKSMFILMIEDKKSIAAAAPMMIIRRGLTKTRVLEFIGNPDSDINHFLFINPRYLETLIKGLISQQDEWDCTNFRDMTHCHCYEHLVRLIRNQKLKFCVENTDKIYFQTGQKPVNAHQILRKEKRLKNLDPVQIEHVKPSHELIEQIMNFHFKRMQELRIHSSFTDQVHSAFLAGLLEDKNNVKLAVLKNTNNLIAALLFFDFQDWTSFYMIVYNPEYSKYSPSLILFKHIISSLKTGGYDFGRGEENYKAYFTSSAKQVLSISIGKTDGFYYKTTLKSWLNKMIRNNPGLKRILQTLEYNLKRIRI